MHQVFIFNYSSTLRHPNIIDTIDLLQDEHGKWCLVMEYCKGGDLQKKINNVGFSGPEELHCLFKQLLLGAEYMHTSGVAHRDLKPENLLLDPTHRRLKISDFGVSIVFRTQFEKTDRMCGGHVGTTAYIAPEEWDDDAKYLPTKVDIWAIGFLD